MENRQNYRRVSEAMILGGEGRITRSTIVVESPISFRDLSPQGQIMMQAVVAQAAMEDLQDRGLPLAPSDKVRLMQRVAGMFADEPED